MMLSRNIFITFAMYRELIIYQMEMTKDINRIKVVLVEKKRTNKWLAEQLGKDPATVSKWCTNTSQPGLETLLQIANVLEVDVKELLNSSLEGEVQMVRLVK
jgi:transcriptional regulator with XRE-family HTH domain